MSDEAAAIRAKGLRAGGKRSLPSRAELTDGAGSQWAAQADFIADAQGVVDASQQAPVAGSYKQISAMGLVWAMMPVTKRVNSYVAIRELAPAGRRRFHLLRQKARRSRAPTWNRSLLADEARAADSHPRGHGARHSSCHPERHDAASRRDGGGRIERRPAHAPRRMAGIARLHGRLALAYFRFQDLPPQLESIPLEYFQNALAWMAKRPEIGDARVGVLGTSRGGELALQLGSMFPRIAAVVAYVPANVRYPSCCRNDGGPAWTWQGRALAYALLRQPSTKARAAIEVEHTQGPILMISGEADHLVAFLWEMADDVLRRLKRLPLSPSTPRI